MTTGSATGDASRWWGELEIPAEAWRRWRIGPLSFWIRRLESEWRLAWQEEAGDEELDAPEVNLPASEAPPESATRERVASHGLGERLIVSPQLADRPVVVRPETRFRLVPGGEVELYVCTPLWVRLETSEPRRLLLDVPTRRPSDSWFGPSTTEGELCYAGRVAVRLHSDNLPASPHRAMTQVRLSNRAADDLLLERLNLPVPNLALFADAGGRLWTQTVSVERGADGELAEVVIADGPPPEAAAAERFAEPRIAMSRNVFSRALGALLG